MLFTDSRECIGSRELRGTLSTANALTATASRASPCPSASVRVVSWDVNMAVHFLLTHEGKQIICSTISNEWFEATEIGTFQAITSTIIKNGCLVVREPSVEREREREMAEREGRVDRKPISRSGARLSIKKTSIADEVKEDPKASDDYKCSWCRISGRG